MRKALALTPGSRHGPELAACTGSTTSESSSAAADSSSSADTSEEASSEASTDGAAVSNSEKPLIWFKPSAFQLHHRRVGHGRPELQRQYLLRRLRRQQGAELQGEMVLDYITNHIDEIDRNGDGVIGYVLAIGDIGHNDSIARTRGVRSALAPPSRATTASSAILSAPTPTAPHRRSGRHPGDQRHHLHRP